MKRVIILTISFVCIGILAVLAFIFGRGEEEAPEEFSVYRFDSDLSDEVQTLTNGSLTLEFDPTTAQITLTDKDGNVWYSNPQDGGIGTRKELQATLIVKYKNYQGIETVLNNYQYSVEKGNYSYEVLSDTSLRVDFSVGDIAREYLIPLAVPEARYNEIVDGISMSDQMTIESIYRFYDINNLFDYDDKNALLEQYPDLETTKVVALRDTTQDWMKEEVERLLAANGYTREDYEQDLEYYGSTTDSEKPAFNVSVIYSLVGEELVVEIPFDRVDYKSDYPITEVRSLPYFGAAGSQDEGYLLVPDGSGARIHFNNGRYTQTNYSARVYGWDFAMTRDTIVSDPEIEFPVFGISYTGEDKSFLCMLEDSNVYAYIEADVAGRRHNYNYVTAAYDMIHNEAADVTGRSDSSVYIFETELPADEKITMRYRFVDSSDYVDMAKAYRSYLLERYPNLAEGTGGAMPMAVELIGAITKTQQVFGFPKDRPLALTTYEQMAEIIRELQDAGVTDMSVILNGWFNDGVTHDIADDVKLVSQLGSKSDFKNMLQEISSMSNQLYLKGEFTFVHNEGWFDSYSVNGDSARFLNREVTELYPMSPLWYGEEDYLDSYYLASPEFILSTLDSFRKEISSYGVKNIAFTSIGNVLSSDYNHKNKQTRADVLRLQTEKLAEMQAAGEGILLYEGNEYAVPYADLILNMALASAGNNIVNDDIPFFAIALHGYVAYTGDAVNLTGDFTKNLLKSAETGAGLYFIFMDADTSKLQDTAYTEYFGANFASWKDDCLTWYERFRTDFAGLYGQTIEDHEILANNVTVTTYADGTKVYVNYRTEDYTLTDGTVIGARDWVVTGGKGGN